MYPYFLKIVHDMSARSLTPNKKRSKTEVYDNTGQNTEESLQAEYTFLSSFEWCIPINRDLGKCVIYYFCRLVVCIYGLEKSATAEECITVYFVYALEIVSKGDLGGDSFGISTLYC